VLRYRVPFQIPDARYRMPDSAKGVSSARAYQPASGIRNQGSGIGRDPSQVVRQVFGGVMLKCGVLMDQVGIIYRG